MQPASSLSRRVGGYQASFATIVVVFGALVIALTVFLSTKIGEQSARVSLTLREREGLAYTSRILKTVRALRFLRDRLEFDHDDGSAQRRDVSSALSDLDSFDDVGGPAVRAHQARRRARRRMEPPIPTGAAGAAGVSDVLSIGFEASRKLPAIARRSWRIPTARPPPSSMPTRNPACRSSRVASTMRSSRYITRRAFRPPFRNRSRFGRDPDRRVAPSFFERARRDGERGPDASAISRSSSAQFDEIGARLDDFTTVFDFAHPRERERAFERGGAAARSRRRHQIPSRAPTPNSSSAIGARLDQRLNAEATRTARMVALRILVSTDVLGLVRPGVARAVDAAAGTCANLGRSFAARIDPPRSRTRTAARARSARRDRSPLPCRLRPLVDRRRRSSIAKATSCARTPACIR
jgi:hypothetical protein